MSIALFIKLATALVVLLYVFAVNKYRPAQTKKSLKSPLKNDITAFGNNKPAVKNLEVLAGSNGERFKETKIKSHTIVCDMFPGTGGLYSNAENDIVNNPKYLKFFTALNDIIDFTTFDENTTGQDLWLYDFLAFVKRTNPEELTLLMGNKKNPVTDFENSKALEVLDKVKKGLAIFKQLGLWLGSYHDFGWNSDWIVPINSQAAGDLNRANLTLLNNPSLLDFSNSLFHSFSTDNNEVSTTIKSLLNKGINSINFDFLPPNSQLIPRPASETNSVRKDKVARKNNIIAENKHLVDNTRIKILSPSNNYIVKTNSILNVKVQVLDTTNLLELSVAFQDKVLKRGYRNSSDQNYNFSIAVDEKWSDKALLFATGKYLINGITSFKYDTLSISVEFEGLLNNFKVYPEFQNFGN